MLKAVNMPLPVATRRIAHRGAPAQSTMIARKTARAIAADWVSIINRRRGRRSAMAPPMSTNNRIGNPRQRLTSARWNGEPVLDTTSQFNAT
ncbi:hypothetical protein D3C87_1780410 [compost metagenome]